MCGIYGLFGLGRSLNVDENFLIGMGECLEHRGPDASGIFVDGIAALGHRRLSIIDLSEAANQPMADEDGEVWIVFNGEIYNFLEEKEKLIAKGYRFRTRSDTEVIINLYKEYGFDLLDHLRGMFAFCIYDVKRRLLFLARDRLGKKPLYYAFKNGVFAFASEPKAILKTPLFSAEPDFEGLSYYLSLGYVPSPKSAFKGVRKLPPGSFMIVSEKGVGEPKRYWSLKHDLKDDLLEEEWCEIIRDELKKAVKMRLISDVPLGVFLSGGVDSSAIVAFMSELSSDVKTYSVGFSWSDYDERKFARIVAERFSTDHHEFVVEPSLEEALPWIVKHYDEPFGDSSAIPSLYISKIARESVTVILNGDGGDENFAGYERYRGTALAEKLLSLPGVKPLGLARGILPLSKKRGFLRKVRKFLELTSAKDLFEFYYGVISQFKEENFLKVIGSSWEWRDYSAKEYVKSLYERFSYLKGVDRLLAVEVRSYLPEDLLVKMDRATMAFSLEARSPLLDHVFMERMARVPPELKLKGLKSKYIFKRALKGILPNEILKREKMGFGVPLEHWFRNELKDFVRESLYGGSAVRNGILNLEGVREVVESHVEGKSNEHYRIWLLLVLEYWWREWFDA